MANGLLSSSRTTLLFAGGVIVCTIIAASSLSADYTPKTVSDGSEQEVTTSVSAESDALAAKRRAEANEAPENEESVFGDYEGLDDEELIDDTMGFDPTPVEDEAWTTVTESTPEKAPGTTAGKPASEGGLTPVSRNSGGNPLQRQATPEDAKRQAAQLKKLREKKKN